MEALATELQRLQVFFGRNRSSETSEVLRTDLRNAPGVPTARGNGIPYSTVCSMNVKTDPSLG
jgi:hypothetical protein